MTTIPGVSMTTAMVLLIDIVDINRSKSLVYFINYVGLILRENSSVDKEIHIVAMPI